VGTCVKVRRTAQNVTRCRNTTSCSGRVSCTVSCGCNESAKGGRDEAAYHALHPVRYRSHIPTPSVRGVVHGLLVGWPKGYSAVPVAGGGPRTVWTYENGSARVAPSTAWRRAYTASALFRCPSRTRGAPRRIFARCFTCDAPPRIFAHGCVHRFVAAGRGHSRARVVRSVSSPPRHTHTSRLQMRRFCATLSCHTPRLCRSASLHANVATRTTSGDASCTTSPCPHALIAASPSGDSRLRPPLFWVPSGGEDGDPLGPAPFRC